MADWAEEGRPRNGAGFAVQVRRRRRWSLERRSSGSRCGANLWPRTRHGNNNTGDPSLSQRQDAGWVVRLVSVRGETC